MDFKIPKLYHHKATNQAAVCYRRKTTYFGVWGLPETEKAYRRWCAELIAGEGAEALNNILVSELARQYAAHADRYYGVGSPETGNIKRAIGAIVDLYGDTPANEFTPRQLKAVRVTWLQQTEPKPLSRGTVNKYTRLLRRMFKWGTSEGFVAYETYAALATVEGLRKGRVNAPEPKAIEPVTESDLQKVLAIAPRILKDMIVLQTLTGMRPGEICNLKRGDIDTTGDIWTVVIHDHKMAHLEDAQPRFAAIGPKGQKVLKRYLLRPDGAHIFNPREAIKDKAAQAETHRRKGQKATLRKTGRKVQDHYTTSSYRKAIARLCESAGIDAWAPNRLRKYAATKVREKYGLDAAQALLGHSSADTSEIYARVNQQKVVEIARQLG